MDPPGSRKAAAVLEVQQYLRSGKTLDDLSGEHAIRVTRGEHAPLVILNYDQIDSAKRHPVVRECRALTLELGTWDVVARSFPRFFNAGECPDLEKSFNFENFTAESKEDGSLMLLYWYGGLWRVNTRGSFATQEISPGCGKTWEEGFYDAVGSEPAMDDLQEGYTYVFEFCSPWNKVVRRYERPTLFLLSAFQNRTGHELNEVLLDYHAIRLRVQRPTRFEARTLGEVVRHLEKVEDPTFEGYVLRDRNGTRLKVKNKDYVRLHHLKDNGNIFRPKNLIPLVLKGEQDEVLANLPEVTPHVFDWVEKLAGAEARMLAVWERAKGLKSQKDFANYVTAHTKFSSVLFQARKSNKDPREVWRASEDIIVRQLAA